MDELVDVVDEHDNVVGEALKSECHKKGIWHRAATIFVFNSIGELLLQKRSANMRLGGRWCSSAAGHLQKGDSYDQGARRELKEELGIECELRHVCKFILDELYPNGDIEKEHAEFYFCRHDGPFDFQKEEISEVRFFDIKTIKGMINHDNNIFTPGFLREFDIYLENLKKFK